MIFRPAGRDSIVVANISSSTLASLYGAWWCSVSVPQGLSAGTAVGNARYQLRCVGGSESAEHRVMRDAQNFEGVTLTRARLFLTLKSKEP